MVGTWPSNVLIGMRYVAVYVSLRCAQDDSFRKRRAENGRFMHNTQTVSSKRVPQHTSYTKNQTTFGVVFRSKRSFRTTEKSKKSEGGVDNAAEKKNTKNKNKTLRKKRLDQNKE